MGGRVCSSWIIAVYMYCRSNHTVYETQCGIAAAGRILDIPLYIHVLVKSPLVFRNRAPQLGTCTVTFNYTPQRVDSMWL